jgi:hypothetical protein
VGNLDVERRVIHDFEAVHHCQKRKSILVGLAHVNDTGTGNIA